MHKEAISVSRNNLVSQGLATMRRFICFLTILLITLVASLPSSTSHAGKLDQARKSASKPSSSKKKSSNRKSSKRDRDRDCDSDFGWLSIVLSSSDSRSSTCRQNKPTRRQTSPRPIVIQGMPSDVIYAEPIVTPAPQSAPAPISQQLDAWSQRITFFGGNDFDDLEQLQFAWLAQQPGGLGLDVSGLMFREDEAEFHDSLWLGDANLVLEPVFGDLRTRVGIGMNWLADSETFEAGLNLTAGFDFHLGDFMVTSGEYDFGSIGSADYSHAQITMGLNVEGVEWFAGYNRFDIGGTKLDGMIYGIRLRF